MRLSPGLCVLLLMIVNTFQAQASEKDELALVMRQLDRFRPVSTEPAWLLNRQDARFYFDYLSASRDITVFNKPVAIQCAELDELGIEEKYLSQWLRP
jgi:RAQPRD family integrative conjugative element protein